LNYFDASGKGAPSLQDRLSISTIGGRPGAAGTGGTGGTGSEGRFQRVNTSDRWFPNGDAGATGATGAGGVAGTAGGVDIQAVAANSSPNWAGEVTSNAAADRGTLISLQQQVQALKETRAPATPDAAGLEQQVQALQEQVKSLEQRVKALEKR
jgi:hypothetical protein